MEQSFWETSCQLCMWPRCRLALDEVTWMPCPQYRGLPGPATPAPTTPRYPCVRILCKQDIGCALFRMCCGWDASALLDHFPETDNNGTITVSPRPSREHRPCTYQPIFSDPCTVKDDRTPCRQGTGRLPCSRADRTVTDRYIPAKGDRKTLMVCTTQLSWIFDLSR